MTSRDDYTPEEWANLVELPLMVGLSVAFTGDSGVLGTTQEFIALGRAIAEGRERFGSSPLVLGVLSGEPIDPEYSRRYGRDDADRLRADTIAKAREVTRLLDSKASSTDAAAYRDLVMSIGARIASAAVEGSRLGFGGRRLSPEEKSLLDAVASALGTAAPPLSEQHPES